MKFGSLFAGIGGMDLGLERAGMVCSWQVEIDDYCTKVLTKHWPNVPKFRDVREVGKHNLEPVDLICGGFPCQPFSQAGQRKGEADNRHLWPEMARIIAEVGPAWVFGENVTGIISMALDNVLSDLEGQGYETQAFVIPACGVGAYHKRERVFILAHANGERSQGREIYAQSAHQWLAGPNGLGDPEGGTRLGQAPREGGHTTQSGEGVGDSAITGLPNWAGGEVGQPSPLTEFERPSGREIERDFRGVAYGVSRRVDRLRSLGNAVVPQVAELIGKRIIEAT